jgi:hypothetical protein
MSVLKTPGPFTMLSGSLRDGAHLCILAEHKGTTLHPSSSS